MVNIRCVFFSSIYRGSGRITARTTLTPQCIFIKSVMTRRFCSLVETKRQNTFAFQWSQSRAHMLTYMFRKRICEAYSSIRNKLTIELWRGACLFLSHLPIRIIRPFSPAHAGLLNIFTITKIPGWRVAIIIVNVHFAIYQQFTKFHLLCENVQSNLSLKFE